MAAAEAEVTSSIPTSPVAAAAERSSIPRSKALLSQTSVEAADRSHRKPTEMNGQRPTDIVIVRVTDVNAGLELPGVGG